MPAKLTNDRVLKTVATATDGSAIQVETYPVGSEALAGLLASSYGMSIDDAKRIKAEREKDPQTHPYDQYRRACAMLEAFAAVPIPVSTRAAWKRTLG